MSIASEITRLQNSKADVKTIVNKDKDIINNGTAFIASETLDDYDDCIEDMQDAYKKFIPIQTASGTDSVTIDNSNNTKSLINIAFDGNTEQTTYTGKNKMAISLATIKTINPSGSWSNNVYTWKGVTFTINDDLSITIGGTFSERTYLYLVSSQSIEKQSYVLNGCPSGGFYSTYQTTIDMKDAGTYVTSMADVGSSATVNFSTYTTPSFTAYIDIRSSGGIGKTFYPMLRLSSVSDATYEPYVGGIASPNPSFPQDVNVVTGENTIDIVGKNLFNKDDVTAGYRLGADGQNYAHTGYNASDYIPISGETTYVANWTLAWDETICVYDANKTFSRRLTSGTTVTTTSSEVYMRIAVADARLSTAQVEKGSTSSTYEAYQKHSYPIKLEGKNKFDFDKFKTSNPSATITGTANNFYYKYTGVASSYDYKFKANTRYYIKGDWSTTYGNFRVRVIYTDNDSSMLAQNYTNSSATGSIGLATASDKTIKNIEITTWTDGNITISNFQIEERN